MKNFDAQVQELKELALEKKLEVKVGLDVNDLTLTSSYDIVDTESGDVYEFSVYDDKYLVRKADSIRRYAELFILKKLFFEMLSYEDKLKSLQLVSTFFNLEDFNKSEENLFENNLNKRKQSTETFNELEYYVKFYRKQDLYKFDILLKIKQQTDKTYRIDCSIDVIEKIIENVREDGLDDKYYYTTIEQAEFDNFPDVIDFFNTLYETASLEFNKLLSEEIKKITKEEQKKQQEEKEQEEQEEKEQEGKPEEGEEEEEGQDGAEKKGGQKGGKKGGKPSLEDLIDDILDSEKSGSDGQSTKQPNDIDLEDFINEIQKGNIENKDFTEQYKNQDLSKKIQDEKNSLLDEGMSSEEDTDEKMDSSKSDDTEQKYDILNGMARFLDTDVSDLKRRFPTEKSVKSFFLSLQRNEINELSEFSNLSTELTIPEAKKILQDNFINDLKNI
jgi:hypothetical protein